MDFSPCLLSGGHESTGPLLFRRSHPRIILASSSLVLRIPPASPPTILTDIQSVCRCPATSFLLSNADQFTLAADVAVSLPSSCYPIDYLSCNNLHALPCRDGSSLLLFFPSGENADEIGFLCLRFKDENLKPDVGVDLDGDIFKQREGLEHPHHRILMMSVIQVHANSSSPASTYITEGFLMATTLYSVNWFRVETRISGKGTVRHLLVPLAKKGFQQLVVDACWSPHISEECAVLLNTGEFYLFNVITKSEIEIRDLLGTNGDSEFLGCNFGAQPWVILIASSTSIFMIDWRTSKMTKVLESVKLPDFLSVVSVEDKDTFQAFCRADYNNFHFAAVTERLLLLFDTRKPMVPILTWIHGLEHPTYVSMFRLSELRPSKEFKLASESGFVILVGSFWKNEFKLFCYGSSDRGTSGSFSAWELPSSLSLSDRQWCSADELVRGMMLKETIHSQEMLLRKQGITGFCVVPNSLLKYKLEPSGFVLIRLTLSGKLEIVEYHACDSLSDKHNCDRADIEKAKDFTTYNVHKGGRLSNRFLFFKLCCLYTYMKGDLSTMLINRYPELNHKAKKHKPLCDDQRKSMSNEVRSSNISISNFLYDVSIPTNVFEVVSQRLLTTLKPSVQTMDFIKYGELPLPVLLVLQKMGMDRTKFLTNEELDDDLLSLECKNVLKNVFPETSIADCSGFVGCGVSQELLDDKHFFVWRPTLRGYRSIFKDTSSTSLKKEEETQMDYLSEKYPVPEYNPNDEELMTFICGISVKNCKADRGHEVVNYENFDCSPVKLDFEPMDVLLKPTEQKNLESLKRQASHWLENYKSYQDFCTSSKIHKSIY